MSTESSSIVAIERRLERLEKQNRRMKQAAVLVILLVGALFVMGQSRAEQRKAIDVTRVTFYNKIGTVGAILEPGLSGILIKDGEGRERFDFSFVSEDMTSLWIYESSPPKNRILLGTNKDGAMIDMGPQEGRGSDKTRVRLGYMSNSGNGLSVTDRQGFETQVGVSTLDTRQTGASTTTSAASIVMFDKQEKVIWKAP